MKKYLSKVLLGAGTLGIIAAGAAAFSAFEAHVINVTARIENALSVPIEKTGLSFGTVFPQEALDQRFNVDLSQSFVDENRVDDVQYTIRQKPKCGIPVPGTDPVQYSGYVQVGEDGQNFVCPQVDVGTTSPVLVQSVALPLLCPYLSKHEVTTDGQGENDGAGINSFHGLPGPWTLATTLATAVDGVLQKSTQDTSDTWSIDLHAPCFTGMCAQDWSTFVHSQNPQADPDDYMANPALEHQTFGCDLWLETTGISTPPIIID